MKRSILILLLWVAQSSMGAGDLEEIEKVPEPNSHSSAPTLSFGLRIDSLYEAGGPVSQGFSIPSVRLTASGEYGKYFNYRFSMGETREFSSVLIPQLMPTEAYLDLHLNSVVETTGLFMRVGMFTPHLNPLWTPDLSETVLPDYNLTHQTYFLGRDMGAELVARPTPHLELALGALNGSGVFTLNTNNSKAFTAYAKYTFDLGSHWNLELGASGFKFNQDSYGSVDYASNSLFDSFVRLVSDSGWEVALDAFLGHYQDSYRVVEPTGGSIYGRAPITNWLSVFSRFESGGASPLDGNPIRHYQGGPVLSLYDGVRAFLFYDRAEFANSGINTLEIRIRWVI